MKDHVIFRLPIQGRYGRVKRAKMELVDGKYTKPSRHGFLDRVASDWGEVNSQSTVAYSDTYLLKNYSCSGHGGYLLFTDTEISGLHSNYSRESWKGDTGIIEPFFVYIFEEDCDWAILSLICTDKTWAKVEKEWKKAGGGGKEGKPLSHYAVRAINSYNKKLKNKLKQVL